MTDEERSAILALEEAVETAEGAAREARHLYGRFFGLDEDFDAIEVRGLVSGYARLRALAERPPC